MARSKSSRSTQIIVEPQELTQFLRATKDFVKLGDVSHKQNGKSLRSEKKGLRRFVGIGCALGVGICLQISNIIVKTLKDSHHPVNLSFWRYFGYVIPTLPYLLGMKVFKNVNLFSSIGMSAGPDKICGCCTVRVKTKNILTVLVVCALSAPVFILRYFSLHYLTIGDSTVILYSGPLFTILFGHFILGEKCGFVTIPISIFTLLGVVVVARPTFLTGKQQMDENVLIGIGITLLATVLGSIFFVLLRLVRHVNFMVMSFGTGVSGLLIAGVVVWISGIFKVPEGTYEILAVTALAFLSFMSICLITAALKFEEAGIVNIVRMVDVFYSFILEFAWFGLIPDAYSIIGAAIVLTGVSLITFRKILSTLPKEHCLRRTFCWLLY